MDSNSEKEGSETQREEHPPQSFASIDRSWDSRPPSGDDGSSNHFFSEPSLSEDGTASLRVLQPHRTPVARPIRIQQGSEDEGGSRGSPRPALAATMQPSPAPTSPGNTSLSSWDSPAPQKVLLQFASESHGQQHDPSRTRGGRLPSSSQPSRESSTIPLPNLESPHMEQKSKRRAHRPNNSIQPRSSPPMANEKVDDDNFLENLRIESDGTFEGSFQRLPLNDEELHGEVHDESNQETDESRETASTRPQESMYSHDTVGRIGGHRNQPSAAFLSALGTFRSHHDESVNMTLSDSDYGDDPLDDTGHYFRTDVQPLDWEIQNSADDEKTTAGRQRVRGKSTHGHRRTRSGDGAAATLATGGSDWKGMENDQIPLPGVDEDEEENDVDNDAAKGASSFRHNRPPRYGWHDDIIRHSHEQPNHVGASYPTGTPDWAAHENSYSSLPSISDNNLHLSPAQQAFHHASWQGHPVPPIITDPQHLAYHYASFSPGSSHSRKLETFTGSMEEIVDYSEADYSEDSDEDQLAGIHGNQMRFSGRSIDDTSQLDEVEHQFENRAFRGTAQQVLRPRISPHFDSPFANLGKKSTEKAQRSAFLPHSLVDDEANKYATFICPRCKTRQREFFTVNDAPRHAQGPSGYLALYFAIYVIASLFIFGLEEGWQPLDCIYFAVITLTTAGLGDFVPTTDANKLICSIFIYFGVACIGLLLGSYIAGMLDDRAHLDRRTKMMDSCPNCARIQMMKEAAIRRHSSRGSGSDFPQPNSGITKIAMSERVFDRTPPLAHQSQLNGHGHKLGSDSHESPSMRSHRSNHGSISSSSGRIDLTPRQAVSQPPIPSTAPPAHGRDKRSPPTSYQLGSPMTRRILGRQSHTRHASFDVGSKAFNAFNASTPATPFPVRSRGFSGDLPSTQPPTITENTPLVPEVSPAKSAPVRNNEEDTGSEDDYDDESSILTSSTSSSDLLDETAVKLRNAKYVFLTLRQALVNSMVIIAVGCIGFCLIEDFSPIDSWYFTTVLLTTVGYGDIVCVTKGGKLFATIYILVAGTILLNNMSLISMIPLELRKRRLERVVLTQFGDQLDDAALRELATGPVIQRLHLSTTRPDGLAECTREMFSLAMLVRLGKVTEEDIHDAFAAFRRLDVNGEGVLNSKSIIAGMIKNRRSLAQQGRHPPVAVNVPPPQRSSAVPPHPMPPLHPLAPEQDRQLQGYWFGQNGSLHVASPGHNYHFVGVDPASASEQSALLPHPGDPAGRSLRSAESFGSTTSRGSRGSRESPF